MIALAGTWVRLRVAGADVFFVEAVRTEQEATAVGPAFPACRCCSAAPRGKTPAIGLDRLGEPGCRLVIFPVSTLVAVAGATRPVLAEIT